LAVIISIASAVNCIVEDMDYLNYHTNPIVKHIEVPFAFHVTMGEHIMATVVVAYHQSLDTVLPRSFLPSLMEFAFKLVNLFVKILSSSC
jgi:hypothetical protein